LPEQRCEVNLKTKESFSKKITLIQLNENNNNEPPKSNFKNLNIIEELNEVSTIGYFNCNPLKFIFFVSFE